MHVDIVLHILQFNIVPIFTLITLGFLLDKAFTLHVATMSKLIFFLFAPAYLVTHLYIADLSWGVFRLLLFCAVFMAINDALARVIARIRKFDSGMENAFKNSIMFNNSGNIGLSLIILVFSSGPYLIDGETPYLGQAVSAMTVMLLYMQVSANSLGFYNMGRATQSAKAAVSKILKLPLIWAAPVALVLRQIPFDFTASPLWPPLGILQGALVATSLTTLGAQLSKTKIDFANSDVYLSAFIRLLIGPALALALIWLFGFTGIIARAIFIAYSVPTMLNTAMIAIEFKNNEAFATQAVVFSTVFSVVTMTGMVYLSQILIPL